MRHQQTYILKKLSKYFLGLAIGLLSVNCTGLVKLKLHENAPDAKDAWLMSSGNSLRQNTVESDILPPFVDLWDKGQKSVIADQPLMLDKYMIVTAESGMLAFYDTEIGDKMGDGQLAPGFNHAPAISGDTLYYASNLGDETLAAFDLSRLKHFWKKKLPHFNTSPLLLNNAIFAGANNGKLFCLDRKTGEVRWEFSSGSAIFGNPAGFDNQVFFSNVKGKIFCLDTKSGKKIWEQSLKENIYAGPVIAGNRVFIGSTSGILYALNTESGEILWELSTRGSIYGNAAYRDGMLYVGNNAHQMMAVNAENGRILWNFSTKGINNSPPLAGPEYLYFGSWDKHFYMLDRKTGKLIYKKEFDKSIKSSPVVYKNRLYIHVANEKIHCLANEKYATKLEEEK